MKLIINAEDLGLSQSINKGIFEGLKEGFITSASMFMNAKYTLDALEQVKKQGLKKVFVTSSVQTDKIKAIKEALQNLGEKNELELTMGESVLTDNRSLKQLSESEGVILMEEIASSNLADINEEVNVCKKYDVSIIGMIVSE